MEIIDQLHIVNISILDARQHLAEIESVMAELETAGMYPAVPTEIRKDQRYVYMRFPGPVKGLDLDAKNRLYIGNDAGRITEARRLAENRRRWEILTGHRRSLEGWLAGRERDIQELKRDSATWKRVSNLEALGPASGLVQEATSPKAA